jgi:hypothetical protein
MEDVLLSGHQDMSLVKGESAPDEEDIELQAKPSEIHIKAKPKGKETIDLKEYLFIVC